MGTVMLRPIRYGEVSAGTKVWAIRNHAGDVTADPATVVEVTSHEIKPAGRRFPGSKTEPVGHREHIRYRTDYNSESSWDVYDSHDAFDARFPERTGDSPSDEAYNAERHRHLERQQFPSLMIEDSDGPFPVDITPCYGAYATISLIVPGTSPDELAEKILRVLADEFPDSRPPKVQTKPVADRRVNVYQVNQDLAALDLRASETYTPVALNVLEAESYWYSLGQHSLVSPVPRNAPAPVLG